jgi:secreted Zn-dependent insulinase-like peptidase
MTNPKNPYSRFTIGNLDTLKYIPEAKNIDVY